MSAVQSEKLASSVLSGDRPAVARAITLAAGGGVEGRRLLSALDGHGRRAHKIGVTGPPGVGKSTLIAGLLPLWRARGIRVAVVACDPASPVSGGAFLGDRLRMGQAHEGDPGLFIRSLASREAGAGFPPAALAAARVLEAAGFERVVLETVGAGQCDTGLGQSVDTLVVLLPPDSGDEYQALKAGLVETADILVVNRADRPGAEGLQRLLREEVEARGSPLPRPPVLSTVATSGEGLPALVEEIEGRAARAAGPAGSAPAVRPVPGTPPGPSAPAAAPGTLAGARSASPGGER